MCRTHSIDREWVVWAFCAFHNSSFAVNSLSALVDCILDVWKHCTHPSSLAYFAPINVTHPVFSFSYSRCSCIHPPPKVSFDRTDTVLCNENRSSASEKPCTSGKRGLERELKELFVDSPITEKLRYSSKLSHSTKPEGGISNRSTRDSMRVTTPTESPPLLYCTKSDCSKAYHLSCLDLKSPSPGRTPIYLL